MTVDLAALAAPTPPEEVKHRPGPGGKTLSYVDARWVMERLDSAVGPQNWQDRYEEHQNGSVRCGIGIRVVSLTKDQIESWVWKWDVGDPSDIEGVKGAHSDAFKRAAVKWGLGRDLYGDKPQNGSRSPVEPRRAAQAESVTIAAAPRLQAVPDGEPEIDADAWAGLVDGTTASVQTRAKSDTPECPDGHGPMVFRPAGESKRTGKPYRAFWGCSDRECKRTERAA